MNEHIRDLKTTKTSMRLSGHKKVLCNYDCFFSEARNFAKNCILTIRLEIVFKNLVFRNGPNRQKNDRIPQFQLCIIDGIIAVADVK